MDYTFERDGVSEQVELERWGWGVVYKDGGELHQFDGNALKFHQFREIEWERGVKMFCMYSTDLVHDGSNSHSGRIDLPVTDGMKVVHFYRNLVLDNGARRVRVYVFGYDNVVTGEQVRTYILPDDRIIVSNGNILNLTEYGV